MASSIAAAAPEGGTYRTVASAPVALRASDTFYKHGHERLNEKAYFEYGKLETANGMKAPCFLGIHTSDHFRPVFDCLSRMEGALLSR